MQIASSPDPVVALEVERDKARTGMARLRQERADEFSRLTKPDVSQKPEAPVAPKVPLGPISMAASTRWSSFLWI
jgi:hypothetical protein